MGLSDITFANSDVVAGQKFYETNFLALIAQMQALNDDLQAKAATVDDGNAFIGASSFSGLLTATGGLNAGSKVLADVLTPVANADAANKSYVDTQVATKGFNYSGVEYNVTMDTINTWQDLDLSDVVGSARTLVILEITGTNAGQAYQARCGGEGSDTYDNHTPANFAGPNSFLVNGSQTTQYMTLMTDASGNISHGASSIATWVVKLIGYIS